MQPYPDSHPSAVWDRGFQLIPAGHLAIEQINNQSDLLPGFQLELLDIECGIRVINTDCMNFYRHLVDPSSQVLVSQISPCHKTVHLCKNLLLWKSGCRWLISIVSFAEQS